MIFLIFVVMTLLEIYVLVSVGEVIGGLSTVLLVIITALVGSILLRQQGWATLAKAQQTMAEGGSPTLEILEGVVIVISGVLLLTPGFITDALGILGLIPHTRVYFIRRILIKNAEAILNKTNFVKTNTVFVHKTRTNSRDKGKETIEGEFWED